MGEIPLPRIEYEDDNILRMLCEFLTEKNEPIMDDICDRCPYHNPGKTLHCKQP